MIYNNKIYNIFIYIHICIHIYIYSHTCISTNSQRYLKVFGIYSNKKKNTKQLKYLLVGEQLSKLYLSEAMKQYISFEKKTVIVYTDME